MKTSTDRILTTHVGSLPRSQTVVDLIFAQEKGEPIDMLAFNATMLAAVDAVVERQVDAGIDIVSDGEMSKISYATYIKDRFTGFDGDSPRRTPADLLDFPSFMKRLSGGGGTPTYRRPCCVGPIKVKTLQPLADDIAHVQAAAARHGAVEVFMNSASPGVISLFQPNQHYVDDDAYLEALAQAMAHEYKAIVDAGLLLQLDSPDLGLGRHMMYRDLDEAAYFKRIEQHVEALNASLVGIPADRIRMHVCWGNYEGPHHKDVGLEKILPIVMKAKPQALLFETSNPRHAHEYKIFERKPLAADQVLVAGVLDTTTNFIEHPEVVADRIERVVRVMGDPSRVLAGTDCGFDTSAGRGRVANDVVWAKLKSMRQGAEIASARLFQR